MTLPIRSAGVLLLTMIFSLGGCLEETPEKSNATRSTPALQTNPEQQERTYKGKELFKKYCSPCHPGGGNVSDPQKTLRGTSLRKNNITTSEAIVRVMRNPASRMTRFDDTTISDKDATEIAEYILEDFK